MRFLPYGRDGLLVDLDDLGQVDAVRRALRGRLDAGGLDGIVEVVPAARTVLVVAATGRDDALEAVRDHLTDLDLTATGAGDPADTGGVVELAVHYDGEDLDLVADDAGLDRAAVIDLHTSVDLTVAFSGFAPGFAYLAGLPEPLHQPRLTTPRTRIPAGSVGVAGEFGGIYPRPSPGGWRLVGRLTDDAPTLFDPDRAPPALLSPGTRVRFRDAAAPSPAPGP